jgi:chromosome segregation ATPase
VSTKALLPTRRIKSLEKQLRDCSARISKERDRIRELLSEYEEIAGHCDEAVNDMEHAAETLSQLL